MLGASVRLWITRVITKASPVGREHVLHEEQKRFVPCLQGYICRQMPPCEWFGPLIHSPKLSPALIVWRTLNHCSKSWIGKSQQEQIVLHRLPGS